MATQWFANQNISLDHAQLSSATIDNAYTQIWSNAQRGNGFITIEAERKIITKSKTVSKLIKEEFKNLSSKPIVKEIMPGLIKLKKEMVSQVVNEMIAI